MHLIGQVGDARLKKPKHWVQSVASGAGGDWPLLTSRTKKSRRRRPGPCRTGRQRPFVMSQSSRAHPQQLCDQTLSQLFGPKIFNLPLMWSESASYYLLRDVPIAGCGIGIDTRVSYYTTDTSCIRMQETIRVNFCLHCSETGDMLFEWQNICGDSIALSNTKNWYHDVNKCKNSICSKKIIMIS